MSVFIKKLFPLALFTLATVAITPFFGVTLISPFDVVNSSNPEYLIFWRLRLPRCLGAFLTGAGLSLCGTAFQAMFRNPLATPYTLGLSSGAALGASLYFHLGITAGLMGSGASLISAFLGCLVSVTLVYAITRARGGFSTSVLLLAGVIISFFFSSLVMFVQYISNAHDAVQIMRWLMGSLSGISSISLLEMALAVGASFWFFDAIASELDLLASGEEIAASRGVNVHRVKLLIFLVTSITVGVLVSITGPIGFVGMIVPQICRIMLGYSHRQLIFASFFLGGALLVLCDLLARLAIAPAELPIGIITAMLGAPFFLLILFRNNRKGEID